MVGKYLHALLTILLLLVILHACTHGVFYLLNLNLYGSLSMCDYVVGLEPLYVLVMQLWKGLISSTILWRIMSSIMLAPTLPIMATVLLASQGCSI